MAVGRVRFVLVMLVVAAALLVTLGMTSPRTVPRLAFLPAPASKRQTVGCEIWQRRGVVWRALYAYPCAPD